MTEYVNLDQALRLLNEGWQLEYWHGMSDFVYLRTGDDAELRPGLRVRLSTYRAIERRGGLVEVGKDWRHTIYRAKE